MAQIIDSIVKISINEAISKLNDALDTDAAYNAMNEKINSASIKKEG